MIKRTTVNLIRQLRLVLATAFLVSGCGGVAEPKPSSPKETRPQGIHLAISPVIMVSSSDHREMPQGLLLREELVARLSTLDHVRVLSRSRNLSLLIEEGIRGVNESHGEKRRQRTVHADYVVFIYAIQTRTGQANGDVILSVYEVGPENKEIAHKRLEDLSWNPLELAEIVFNELRSLLPIPDTATDGGTAPDPLQTEVQEEKVYAILPLRAFGVSQQVQIAFEPVISSFLEQTIPDHENGVSLVDRSRILDVLREHSMSAEQIGSELVHASLARIMGADEILIPNLLLNRSQDHQIEMTLSLMGVDAETGIVTRSHRLPVSDDVNNLPGSVTALMAGFLAKSGTVREETLHENPQALLQEFNLYGKWIAGFRSQLRSVFDLHWILAIEMLESAVYLSHSTPESDVFGFLEQAIPRIFDEPESLNPYVIFRPHYNASMRQHFYDIVETAVLGRISGADSGEQTRGGIVLTQAAIRANLPDAAKEAIQYVEPAHKSFPILQAQICLLRRDGACAEVWLDQMPDPDREVFRLRAISAFYNEPGGLAEYEWLRQRFASQMRLGHRDTDRRTLFLANFHEPPERRLELVDRHLSSWASGTDLAIFTRAKALVEMGETARAKPMLQLLAQKNDNDNMLRQEFRVLREEIPRLLEIIGDEGSESATIRYVDVNPPPDGLKYYIQPLGRFDPEELAAAARRVEDFSGLTVIVREPWDLPDDETLYNRATRQYDVATLRIWLVRQAPIPEDAVLVAYLLEEDIQENNGWIYASTLIRSSLSIISSFRWKRIVKPSNPKTIGDAYAKAMLTGLQYPLRSHLGARRIESLIGTRRWPNHAGTIQYSRGSATEVVQAPFTLCQDTAKLVGAVDWHELMKMVQTARMQFYTENDITFP